MAAEFATATGRFRSIIAAATPAAMFPPSACTLRQAARATRATTTAVAA
ncbi:MAG TPA: hypothetical protein VF147_01015 [Vicinamibacterales bacterium]